MVTMAKSVFSGHAAHRAYERSSLPVPPHPVASCEELKPFRFNGECVFPGTDAVTADKIGIPFTGVENCTFQGIIDEAGTQAVAPLDLSVEFEGPGLIRVSLSCTAVAGAKAGKFFLLFTDSLR